MGNRLKIILSILAETGMPFFLIKLFLDFLINGEMLMEDN